MKKRSSFSFVSCLIALACIGGFLCGSSSAVAEQPSALASGDVEPGVVGSVLSGLPGSIFLSSRDVDSEARKRAVAIWEQAASLQREEKYEEALEKYWEGLGIFDDPVVLDHVAKMEDFLALRRRREEVASAAAARARAVAVWEHAADLQKAGQYEEALEEYRKGLAVSSDSVVEEHVDKLEEFIARRKAREAGKKMSP